MCPIFMNIDVTYLLGVDIAGDMISLVDHKALLPTLLRFIGEGCAEETGSYHQVVIMLHTYFLISYLL